MVQIHPGAPGRLAQLARAFARHAKGHRFKSCTAHMKTIYNDENVLVLDKPPGITVFSEKEENTLIKEVIKEYPELKKVGEDPRYGAVHRLDKDTSGLIFIAKSKEALIFFQKQFKQRRVEKKYKALLTGSLNKDEGEIRTLIGRNPKDRKKQKVFLKGEPSSQNLREAITFFKVLKRFKEYTLVETSIKTGRKHQIRVHFSYLGHPLAGDEKYGFKNQSCPKGLKRHFLHSFYLKIKMLNGKEKEFFSELPEDLEKTLKEL